MLKHPLTERFNWYLKEGKVPSKWKTSKTVLIYKKGKTEDIKNYRPICLLSTIYKIFSRLILKRIKVKITDGSCKEQAGFKRGFSTIDHIHTLNQIIERCNEYKKPLALLFIDFEKAFDSVEHNAVLKALCTAGIEHQYIQIIKEINANSTTSIELFDSPIQINIERGVRQGDVISPNLFSCLLDMIMNNIAFSDNEGININGEKLNFLAFADDIVLVSENGKTAGKMLQKLHQEAEKYGLKVHPGKTQWMVNNNKDNSNIHLGSQIIKKVDEYKYLGQLMKPSGNIGPELANRIKSSWVAFQKIQTVVTSNKVPRNIKADLFNTIVLPALLYASETWSTTLKAENKLRTTQRAMERRITNNSKRLHKRAETIREESGVQDVITELYRNKQRWAGHVARMNDNRWTIRATNWYPYGSKRQKGRPHTRWADPLRKTYGITWTRAAQNRSKWRRKSDLHLWRQPG